MIAEDAVLPWSSSRILRSFESSPELRAGLLSLANCYSNVASRTILCPLFSHRSLQQLSFSPALGTFSSMCNHALAQQQRYETEVGSEVSAADVSKNRGVADEVTFAAVVTGSYLEESTVNLGAALLPLIGSSHGHLLSTLKKRLQLVAQCSLGIGKNEEEMTASSVRKTITLLPHKKTEEKNTRGTFFCRNSVFPETMTCTTNVASVLSTSERRELLKRLGDVPLPFQVRSREELKQEQMNQKAFEASLTVVLTEPVGLLPPWKRRKTDVEEKIVTESIPDSETVVRPISLPNLPKPPSNATWVKDGELVLVNGRLVHRETKRPAEGTIKKEKEAVSKSEKEKENSTTIFESNGCSKQKRITADSARKKKTTKEDRETSSSTTKITAVSTQNVPLKTRNEIVALVNELNISDTLREALLIGLNVDEMFLKGKKEEEEEEKKKDKDETGVITA
ncbi:hypothetical protein LSM04_009414 [Trypanosoma melophagium]|uniref:uncharacterized protein n=1 Tax=Trypanosoma melophagium TaxID=715481 RepID=UPI00351A2CBB|nr:hypothetical protein LSM04_009414 [Trypanosoma melophagium]